MINESPKKLETKEKLPRLGMLMSQLNTETLREVLIIYDRVCGGRVNELALDKFANPLDHTIDNIKTRLKDGNAADWGVSCTY
ncbi:MAG: hypothetical protein A2915_04415 [Candidatus Yanofskybacteria bacterium RIFCSPLOWO2_01_FULL_41_34]|uniref:Uncharacterized protein n=1 Tax=Candidatus Yanofskybacteria bacterium RIFCSPHIGHO2_01_FULL_41_26 TaxID=1802661 RepID=A0A1F8EBN8_9BACT|nr:MAG: hypothetical protein A2649_03515 [Candidatus Yanofskybacteria bacterium RIFCSPHIGHO2_01_FULL_41_26]OGN21644.1 MAG: hypothetical protein A2915_04415 [Candidatus Yanofskybacteria bacterium RIFCSPLOWO2_01_FULL_41_34]